MGKNDFDIDFEFGKEYDFDPEEFFGSENPGDFDLNQIDLDTGYAVDANLDPEAEFDLEEEDDRYYDEDFTSDIDFSKRKNVDGQYDAQEEPVYEEEYTEDAYSEDAYVEEGYQEEYPEQDELTEEYEEEPVKKSKKKLSLKLPKMKKREKAEKPKKPKKPSIFSKFVDLYFGPMLHKEEPEQEEQYNENGTRRRRRKPTRTQILKEVYLPPIILCAALLVVLSLAIGSATNAIKLKRIDDDNKKKDEQAAAQQADQAEIEFHNVLKEAENLVTQYDYKSAIEKLESYETDNAEYQQMLTEKKSEYVNTQNTLQEWKDPNAIANLSFHVLINDPQRAYANQELGGQYNRNFVEVTEFARILDQLYSGGYVLVDFDSFVASNTGLDGNKSFFMDPILLPAGKKPIMLTETMVNYFEYMVDGDKDGVADAKGDGFASKLVLTQSGDIKAEYVDASGQTRTGDYDFVPVLENFIKEHPDFSYRGARAILAVTGTQGVFGYRTNTSYISSKSQEFYEQEVAEAKVLVDALREKGYTIACYTYNNENYRNFSVAQIKSDIQAWNSQITPILGDVDVMVFARSSDIDDYSGNKFNVLYDAGFRFFVGNSTTPSADVNNTFVRQSRLMVTGNGLGWQKSVFATYFDCDAVVDLASRGNIPN